MASFLDVCRFAPTAGGTTDWTFSAAVIGYQSPTAANAVNGAIYRYRAESADLTQWEVGFGAYNSATGVFARTTVLFNSLGTTAKVSFTVAPQVAIVALAEDLFDIGAWVSYAPSISAVAGAITTIGAVSGRYKRIGKTIILQVDATITTAGTAGGPLTASLPFNAAAFAYMGSSRDFGVSGKGGPAFISASDAIVSAQDSAAATYFANGARVVIGITYEIP